MTKLTVPLYVTGNLVKPPVSTSYTVETGWLYDVVEGCGYIFPDPNVRCGHWFISRGPGWRWYGVICFWAFKRAWRFYIGKKFFLPQDIK